MCVQLATMCITICSRDTSKIMKPNNRMGSKRLQDFRINAAKNKKRSERNRLKKIRNQLNSKLTT